MVAFQWLPGIDLGDFWPPLPHTLHNLGPSHTILAPLLLLGEATHIAMMPFGGDKLLDQTAQTGDARRFPAKHSLQPSGI